MKKLFYTENVTQYQMDRFQMIFFIQYAMKLIFLWNIWNSKWM